MKQHKGVVGRFLASELIELGPWDGVRDDVTPHWPEPLRTLVTRLFEVLLPAAGVTP